MSNWIEWRRDWNILRRLLFLFIFYIVILSKFSKNTYCECYEILLLMVTLRTIDASAVHILNLIAGAKVLELYIRRIRRKITLKNYTDYLSTVNCYIYSIVMKEILLFLNSQCFKFHVLTYVLHQLYSDLKKSKYTLSS